MVQILIVAAVLAGFYMVPAWWEAVSDLRAARGDLQFREYQDMILALNRVMAGIDDATDLRYDENWQRAAITLNEARRVWREEPLDECDEPEAMSDPDLEKQIVALLCTNRERLDSLLQLQDAAIVGRAIVVDDTVLARWEEHANLIDANSDAVLPLIDQVRPRRIDDIPPPARD